MTEKRKPHVVSAQFLKPKVALWFRTSAKSSPLKLVGRPLTWVHYSSISLTAPPQLFALLDFSLCDSENFYNIATSTNFERATSLPNGATSIHLNVRPFFCGTKLKRFYLNTKTSTKSPPLEKLTSPIASHIFSRIFDLFLGEEVKEVTTFTNQKVREFTPFLGDEVREIIANIGCDYEILTHSSNCQRMAQQLRGAGRRKQRQQTTKCLIYLY